MHFRFALRTVQFSPLQWVVREWERVSSLQGDGLAALAPESQQIAGI